MAGGSGKKKSSLSDRRLLSGSKLTLSVTKRTKNQKNPLQQLREGVYDIHTNHLNTVSNDPDDTESVIDTFLQEQNVHPVHLQ